MTAFFVGGKGDALRMVLENAGIDEATDRKAFEEGCGGKHGGLGGGVVGGWVGGGGEMLEPHCSDRVTQLIYKQTYIATRPSVL